MLTFICSVDTIRTTVVPEGYSLRAARRGDIEQLGRIYFDSYEAGVACETVEEAVADIQASFDGEYGELLSAASPVALDSDNHIVATVLTVWRAPWDDTPDCPFIIEAFTARHERRRGLARALISAAATGASQQGAHEVALRVAEDNTAAVHLYRGLGFRGWGAGA